MEMGPPVSLLTSNYAMPLDPSTARCIIRPMEEVDLRRVFAWRNAEPIHRWMFNPAPIEWDTHRAWFERACQNPRKHLLIFQADGEAAGFAQFGESGCGRIADWGFYTGTDTPKGFGHVLCRHALAYGFTKLGLHKVNGQVLAGNLASRRLHERLGFRPEGALRDQHFDGMRYHTVYCFGLLNEEWHS